MLNALKPHGFVRVPRVDLSENGAVAAERAALFREILHYAPNQIRRRRDNLGFGAFLEQQYPGFNGNLLDLALDKGYDSATFLFQHSDVVGDISNLSLGLDVTFMYKFDELASKATARLLRPLAQGDGDGYVRPRDAVYAQPRPLVNGSSFAIAAASPAAHAAHAAHVDGHYAAAVRAQPGRHGTSPSEIAPAASPFAPSVAVGMAVASGDPSISYGNFRHNELAFGGGGGGESGGARVFFPPSPPPPPALRSQQQAVVAVPAAGADAPYLARVAAIKAFVLAAGNEDVFNFLRDHKAILRDGSPRGGAAAAPLEVSEAELRAAALTPAKQAHLVELGLLAADD